MKTYYQIVSEAIKDIRLHGYDSQRRIDYWRDKIRKAAKRDMVPLEKMENDLKRKFKSQYNSYLSNPLKNHSIGKFTIEKIKPKLRAELEKRMSASRELIKVNREEMIEKTIQRFSGWATSIPSGGTKVNPDKNIKDSIRKPLSSLPFKERRVMIDQGAKFISAMNDIVAAEGGAIAAKWRARISSGYKNREEHKERNNDIYLIRDSWAHKKGFVKPNQHGYTDEIEKPAELPYCSCYYRYIYNVSSLPEDMLTNKGKEFIGKTEE